MDLRAIFVNDAGRARSGWRVAIFLAAFLITASFLGLIAFGGMAAAGVDLDEHHTLIYSINGIISLVPALIFGWLFGWLFEGLPFRALGASFTPGWFRHLVLGLVVGTLTIGVAVLIAVVPGGLSFTFDPAGGGPIAESLLVSLGVFAVAAAFEEALFRGYILQTLNRSGLGWLAIALTSILFGAVHLANPGASLFSTINTSLAGVWFGIAYLRTRDLWFPFAIHLIWNWVQGSVFGIEVSGTTDVSASPLLVEIDKGPAWLTGEHYGIEASIACTIAILVSIVVIYFMPGLSPSDEMLAMTGSETAASNQPVS